MRYLWLLAIVALPVVGCSSADKNADMKDASQSQFYYTYGTLLGRFVTGESVDYAALQKDRRDLDKFIEQLGAVSTGAYDSLKPAEQKALWINAYNAIVLRTVIDYYPLKSIKNVTGVLDSKKWNVAGRNISLNEIEHDMLRPLFKDARIHFAINNASKGAPFLQNRPFLPSTIDAQLDEAAMAFVNEPKRNKINPHNNTITTSELFSWFGDEFIGVYGTDAYPQLEPARAAALKFIFTYADSSIFEFVDTTAQWTVEFAPYDWSLNDIKR